MVSWQETAKIQDLLFWFLLWLRAPVDSMLNEYAPLKSSELRFRM